jgi:hypothetical protein
MEDAARYYKKDKRMRESVAFNRWRYNIEQFFSFAEYLIIKIALFTLAVIGLWAVVKTHL